MPDSRPWTIKEYRQESLTSVKAGCIKVFQALGAFRDYIVIVGGLVPALLIDQPKSNRNDDPAVSHVGTRDVDIGFSLGIIEYEPYRRIVERLGQSGFRRDKNEAGNLTNHRWITEDKDSTVTVDFQIPPDEKSPAAGKMQNITGKLSAIVTPGLRLAFKDTEKRIIEHKTPAGDQIEREIKTCGPASFLVLKALAINEREKWKDYYDIFYLLRNWPEGIKYIAEQLIQLKQFDRGSHVETCVTVLRRDFKSLDHVGPRNVARFFYGEDFQDLPNNDPDVDHLLRQSQLLVESLVSYL
ncbi:nucleotidyl transferase AbiEii/AbiGii toxin family protein [Candidatus Bipolaricaulota bacterium]|nr:nucleotidyl transferase AbiEii/AbiGii toxin family protein [Candidatus Bipolaricaulota bacterium]